MEMTLFGAPCGQSVHCGVIPGQLSASFAVMLLLQDEHNVVDETVSDVNR